MENDKVTLRHPHSGDTVTVNATESEMVPYMARGYQHVPLESENAAPAHSEPVHPEPIHQETVATKVVEPKTFDPKTGE